MQLSGLPAGASGSFTSNTITTGGSTTLNINAGTAAPGTYTLTVTGAGSANAHSTTTQLIVIAPPQNDFSISVSPPSQTVAQGASTSYTVSTAIISGNSEPISLQLSGLPAGASGSFTSNTVTTGGSTTLNINAGTAAPGTYTFTVTGAGSTFTHSATPQLIVIAPTTPTPTPTPTATAPPHQYAAQVQPPINADGSSVFNVRRGVVPVKFTLTDNGSPTCTLPSATIAVTRTAGGTLGDINESVYSGSADSGSNFRIDSCQYVYNLNSGALGAGTYRVDIKINNQVVGSGVFQLK